MKRFGLFLAAMFLVAAFATACGGSSSTSEQSKTGTASSGSAQAMTGPAAATITIAGMGYGQPVTVPPGAQIALKNNDSVEHSVTSDAGGKFSVDVEANGGGTLTAPTEPGQYAFHCKYHPSMHGTLTVT